MPDRRHPIIVVATILHEEGPTGVQAHFKGLRTHLRLGGRTSLLVTPYSAAKYLVYPIFAVRKLINLVSGTASVWWYRFWHERLLRSALHRTLSTRAECVIYAQCPLSARAALQARRGPDQRVVMVVHFNFSQADEWSDRGEISRDGFMARRIRTLESRVLSSLDSIVYVSRYMRGRLEEAIPQLRNIQSAVIPNFCCAPEVLPERAKSVDIINIGTLEPRKNQQFLLEVLAYAASQGKTYGLALVGDGPDRTKLARSVRDLGIEKQVAFVGNRPRAVELLGSARIYAHAAIAENLPMALIEALGCGVPVVAPAVGGIPEILEPGEAGQFWKLDDVRAAGELLIRLLEDETKLEAMGMAASKRFHEQFDSAVVADRLIDFIINADGAGSASTMQHAPAS